MPFDFLTGSHRLYKAQTAPVLSWLTETETKYDVRPPQRTSIGSSNATTVGPAYVVDVNDIVLFARLVVEAAARPPPANVLKDLSLAISSRRRFSDWYQSRTIIEPALQQSNEGHRHFNSVLEELLNVLTPRFEREVTVSDEPASDFERSSDISYTTRNPFDILELEFSALMNEKDDLDSGSATISASKSKLDEVQTEMPYELQDPRDDLQFAVFKMFADVHQIRKHIHGRVEQYRTRSLSLASLSAVINCAIGLVRGIEKDFMDAAPQFIRWEQVMDTLVTPAQFEGISRGSLSACKIAEHISGRVPMLRINVSQTDSQDQWKTDKIILHELFVEIISLGFKVSLPAVDELTRGVEEVLTDEPIDLWLVFGLQNFPRHPKDTRYGSKPFDLNYSTILTALIGEDVTRPFREFKASSNALKSNMERLIKSVEVIGRKHMDKASKDGIRQNSIQLVEWTTTDFYKLFRETHRVLGPGRPFFFLSHSPVLCGSLHWVTLLKSQVEGMQMMNKTLYAVSAAHLYNAVTNEGHVQSHWLDMEKLIDHHGPSSIFLGSPPKTISAYGSHHSIAIGCSIKNFAKDSREVAESSSKRAKLLKVSKIMETFEKFIRHTDAETPEKRVSLLEVFLPEIARQQLATQKKGSSLSLDTVQLLVLVEHYVVEDEAKLVFDYYALHHSCWMLLFKIYSELRKEFLAWLPAERRDSNPNLVLHFLPALIFSDFAQEQDKHVGKETIVMDDYISKNAQNLSPTTAGDVNEDGLKTETEHGTQEGHCIHWGSCDRMAGGVQSWISAVDF